MFEFVVKNKSIYYYIAHNRYHITANPGLIFKCTYNKQLINDLTDLTDGIYYIFNNNLNKMQLNFNISEYLLDPIYKVNVTPILKNIDEDSKLYILKLIKSVLSDNDEKIMRD